MKIIFLCLFLAIQIFGKTILCDHPQSCLMLKNAIRNNEHIIDPLNLIKGDPHYTKLDPNSMKKLITTQFVLLSPNAVFSWNRKIVKKRLFKTTYQLELPRSTKTPFFKLEHYWLFHDTYCPLYSNLLKKLYPTQEDKRQCPVAADHEEVKKQAVKFKKSLFIVAHAPLKKLFSSMGIPSISLMSEDHHHHGVTTKKLKKLRIKLSQYKKRIWIFEKQIELPSTIRRYVEKQDHKIHLSTLNGPVLKNLAKELEQIL
jgi:hypothetical protein